MADVTRILEMIQGGDAKATDELLPVVYEELRLLAARKLSSEPPGQTLQATALVHEAYLRLVGDDSKGWDNRGHFFAAAAEAMRRILVEKARRKNTAKRGGNRARIDLPDLEAPAGLPSDELVLLDQALNRLHEEAPLKAELVKLRFFAGLSIDQAAEALGISRATAIRDWSFARAWLYQQVRGGD